MKSQSRRRLLIGAGALVAMSNGGVRAQGGAHIVASFSLLADMARELAPPGTEVTALVGPNSDSHVFEPGPADGRRLARADLVIVNGLGFEGWIDRLVKVSGYRGLVVVASHGVKAHGLGRHPDPHAWQDLAHARQYVGNLAGAFAERWPDRQADIRARSVDYLARIDQLERRVRERLEAIPRAQRRVITSHDAFGYFGRAYGVDFIAPQGWNTHSQPSAAAVARLIRQIRRQEVRAIFIENISDPRLIRRIAQESGVQVGGTLYSDALGAPGGSADTYLKMIEHNARTLADALAAR